MRTYAIQKKKTIMRNFRKYKSLYLLLLPGFIYLVIFKFVPIFGGAIAFMDLDIFGDLSKSQWVGFKHFEKFFSSIYFRRVFGNSIIISGLKIVFEFPVPIILALLMNELRNQRFKKVVQTISYLPHFLSWVVVGALAYIVLSSDGIVNIALNSLGFDTINFLSSEKYFRGVILFTSIWKSAGWGTIIYLAAITGVDAELYEAAICDGAGRLRQTWHITLPAIKSTVIIMLIFRIGHIMEAGFEQIFVMYTPSVYSVSDIIDTYVYREGLRKASYGYATAVGLFKSVINVIFITGANIIAKKSGETGVW